MGNSGVELVKVLAALAGLLAAATALPGWVVFLVTLAFAKGLVALGLVVMMRGGLVSFGQGLVYCVGAYAAALVMAITGLKDVVLLALAGGLSGTMIGLIIGPMLASYRGIFFATLTLALSMIVYGVFNKLTILGGSDGINLHAPSYIGWQPSGIGAATYALYAFTTVLTVVLAAACRRYFGSVRGLLTQAVRDNEIRVEYLGTSVRSIGYANFVIASGLGGLGGALSAIALGHVDPEFAFWTTSGEFVFLAVLAGWTSVTAVFGAAVLLELVRSFSSQYFPNAWQMVLGFFLLLVILFLPAGLGSLFKRRRLRPSPQPAIQRAPAGAK
jgi:ABC-type branched-subunit amino acid transport system permease subunit